MTGNSLSVSREFVNSLSPVSAPSFSSFEKMLQFKSLRKGDTFIRVGQPNTSEYVILDGVCRSYLLNPEKEEITLSFLQGPCVLSPHLTRTRNDISNMNYQALTAVDIAWFSAHEFLNLMIENLEIRNFGNTILRNELMRKIEKEIGMASLTAKERLAQLRKDYSMLENLIPHPHIASYLGITTISLSRLRSEKDSS